MKSAWKCVRNTCPIRQPELRGILDVLLDVALRVDHGRAPLASSAIRYEACARQPR